MGLEIVEFLMDAEKALDVHLEDDVMAEIRTVREFTDYLVSLLPQSTDNYRLFDRVYDKLSSLLERHAGIPPRNLSPSSSLEEIISPAIKEFIWDDIGASLGLADWPKIKKRILKRYFKTVGELVNKLVACYPCYVAKNKGEGWTRDQISEVVHRLMERGFGLAEGSFSEDSEFVKDLGLS